MIDRKSFAAIETKSHPEINNRTFNFNAETLSGEENIDLVREILDLFAPFLADAFSGTGEWAWLQENKQKNFIHALEQKDEDALMSFLSNMFRGEATYGYLSPSFSDAVNNQEQVGSAILCDIDTCTEFTDLNSESELVTLQGNPYGCR